MIIWQIADAGDPAGTSEIVGGVPWRVVPKTTLDCQSQQVK